MKWLNLAVSPNIALIVLFFNGSDVLMSLRISNQWCPQVKPIFKYQDVRNNPSTAECKSKHLSNFRLILLVNVYISSKYSIKAIEIFLAQFLQTLAYAWLLGLSVALMSPLSFRFGLVNRERTSSLIFS